LWVIERLVRAHYLPLFSRLGPYDRADFDAKTYRRGAGALFEYWAHEASLLPIELHPLLRWRMARARNMDGIYKRLAEFARERRAFVEAVLAEVAARGPISASELGRRERRSKWVVELGAPPRERADFSRFFGIGIGCMKSILW
jgi:uncharacterized protein